MAELFDADNPAHVAARARMDTELIMWLVTTAADGAPHPAPVWFFWHDGVISMLSEPDTIKATHLRRGSKATLHMNAGPFGDDVAILHGDVRMIPDAGADWIARFREPYVAKYATAIERYGMPVEKIGTVFSTVIEFTPTRVIAWGA